MEAWFASLPDNLKTVIRELEGIMAGTPPGYESPGWKGHRFPYYFNSETAKALYEDYEFEENTVIVSSFSKTGTHWIGQVAKEIIYAHDQKALAFVKSLSPMLFMMEVFKPEKIQIFKRLPLSRICFTTHLPEPLINFAKVKKSKCKVIVLVRNPKDQVVSLYHFSKGPAFDSLRKYYSPEWSQFYADFIAGKQPVPGSKPGEGYAEFLLGWYKHWNDDNVLFLQYEKMKKDSCGEIQRMSEFLGVNLSEEQISRIAEKTSFSSMKKEQEEDDSVQAKEGKMNQRLRKGQVGSWKHTFTVAQSEVMDKLMEEKLSGTEIKFIYE